jgi:hypothetical protein
MQAEKIVGREKMTKKTSSKKSSALNKSLTKRLTPKQKAPSQMKAMSHAPGVRVKCIVDMGHVGPGTIGKITQVVPEAGAYVVRFDGVSHDTLVALTDVKAMAYAPGDRVKCTINIGPVIAGTEGTVTLTLANLSRVLFEGTSQDTVVPNEFLVPA